MYVLFMCNNLYFCIYPSVCVISCAHICIYRYRYRYDKVVSELLIHSPPHLPETNLLTGVQYLYRNLFISSVIVCSPKLLSLVLFFLTLFSVVVLFAHITISFTLLFGLCFGLLPHLGWFKIFILPLLVCGGTILP